MNPKPGEVWLADLGLVGKMKPIVIVSRYEMMIKIKQALVFALDLNF